MKSHLALPGLFYLNLPSFCCNGCWIKAQQENGSPCPYGVHTCKEARDPTDYLWPAGAVAYINVRLTLLWSHNCSAHTSPTHIHTHEGIANTGAYLGNLHKTELKPGYICGTHMYSHSVVFNMLQRWVFTRAALKSKYPTILPPVRLHSRQAESEGNTAKNAVNADSLRLKNALFKTTNLAELGCIFSIILAFGPFVRLQMNHSFIPLVTLQPVSFTRK